MPRRRAVLDGRPPRAVQTTAPGEMGATRGLARTPLPLQRHLATSEAPLPAHAQQPRGARCPPPSFLSGRRRLLPSRACARLAVLEFNARPDRPLSDACANRKANAVLTFIFQERVRSARSRSSSPSGSREADGCNESARGAGRRDNGANSVRGRGVRAPGHSGTCSSAAATTTQGGATRDYSSHAAARCGAPRPSAVPQRNAAGGRSRAVEVTSRLLLGPLLPAMVGTVRCGGAALSRRLGAAGGGWGGWGDWGSKLPRTEVISKWRQRRLPRARRGAEPFPPCPGALRRRWGSGVTFPGAGPVLPGAAALLETRRRNAAGSERCGPVCRC